MSAILNSFNIYNFPIFQPFLVKLESKFMVYRALFDKTYLLSGLRSPLSMIFSQKGLRTNESQPHFAKTDRKIYTTFLLYIMYSFNNFCL